jgi:dipeptidyl-peptidase-4
MRVPLGSGVSTAAVGVVAAAMLLAAPLVACGAPQHTGASGAEAASGRVATSEATPDAREGTVAATQGKIPIEDVARYPLPGMAYMPSAVRPDPAGRMLTYLWSEDGSLTRQLYAHDPNSGERKLMFAPQGGGATEQNLSLEEKLRRERARERGLGVTSYQWAKEANRVLVPVRGDLWVQDGLHGTPRLVAKAEGGPCIDPQITRDGSWIAYVHDDELYVVSAEENGPAPRQLTHGARGTGRSHGLAEYAAQEEMDRSHGFWWSHDGSMIAYETVDETAIPIWRIVHLGDAEPSWEDHRYPFAGAANAKVELSVIPREGGTPVAMKLAMDGESEIYLARVHWTPAGELMAELENRAQTRLQLVRFDLRSGEPTVVLEERSDVWINLHHMFEPLEHGEGELQGAFVWGSERSGFRHLYLLARDGRVIRPLTQGEWIVDSLVAIDEPRQLVYFTASKDGPTEMHLYRVPLGGGDITRITQEPGMHGVVMDRARAVFVDTHSSMDAPPSVSVRMAEDGRLVHRVAVPPDPRVQALALTPPEIVQLAASDGTPLFGTLYRPGPEAGPPPWPTIVSVYGGPHAQRVTHSWEQTVDMRAQYLRQQGYLVFELDNRGSARRGLAFEGAIKHDLGNIEVQDQVAGVNWLVAQGFTDPKRVGIYGWSYGGYMAAMALVRAPETFKAGVAGAMVSSWDGYDTHYTERYMGTPAGNPEGYRSSSVMSHVEALRGDLLLVHGAIDENVHFRHSARLIDALVKARKPYELMMFPSERHMPRGEADRVYMEERIRDFFDRSLRAP